MRRILSLIVVAFIYGLIALPNSGVINAITGSDWRAGRIIDDSVFMNKNAMSVADIQAFLDAKVPNCETNHAEDPSWRDLGPLYVCLKSFREDPNIPIRNCTQEEVAAHFGFGPGHPDYEKALNYCWWKDGRTNLKGATVGPGSQSSAQIIWQAAQDYTINPQVLLVTLQKEQSLITDTWPWVGQFQKAMGYACPDTAACDPGKRGFYNQVRSAAWQLRRYIDYPDNYNFGPGNRFIQYNPNAGCGGTTVNIETRATAALYNYTPYQPNQAALNNLYGTGDGCSAYGNRNFWRLYHDWFGNPQIDPNQDVVIVGDWDGDGKDTPGIRRGNSYLLDYDNDGVANIEFGFGLTTDKHIIGDWDGDGSDEIGLKRGERYYFSTDFNGTSEIYQGFGNATDQTIVGDWDGDGRDNIGLKRGNRFYFDFNYDGTSELYMGAGDPTDGVFVGDWDGDGDDNIALRRGDHYYFDFGHDGNFDASFGYGSTAHGVIVGDWDGDGRDSMGLKHGEFYYLDNNFDGETDIYTGIGQSSDKSFVGDWDENGRDSIGIKRGRQFFLDNTYDGTVDIYIVYNY